MRSRDLIIVFVCISLAIGFLLAAGFQLEPINSQRQKMGLVIDKPENIPPSLAFATIATGAFRGLVVDILWIRADRLKEAGQFFDAKQLAEWITLLQPRFGSVWVFQAWNMAYNISVAIPATQPDQRWQWVKNGYELLRDEAISKYKLKDIEIYQELARIFQHKIGAVSDDAHRYYKLRLALDIEPLLDSTDLNLTGEDNKYYDLLVKAPASWQEMIQDSNVAAFVKDLTKADSNFADEDNFVGDYLSLRENAQRFDEEAGKVIDDYRGTDVLKKFDIFAKAYKLRTVWKLDPNLMREVNHRFGPVDFNDPNIHYPMDWRHADSHAIYWAYKGLKIASKDPTRDITSDEINTDRYIAFSLQNLFRLGKLKIIQVQVPVFSDDPTEEPQMRTALEVFTRPDLRYFKSYNDTILRLMEKYNSPEQETTLETYRTGHKNMLKNAVLSFYQSGHIEQSRKIFNYMKKLYPLKEFNVSLAEFARDRMIEELDGLGYKDAQEQVTAYLKQSFYYLAIYDDAAAAQREKDARTIYDYYQKEHKGDSNPTDMPAFNDLKIMAIEDFMNEYPYDIQSLLLRRAELDNEELYKMLMSIIEKELDKQNKPE